LFFSALGAVDFLDDFHLVILSSPPTREGTFLFDINIIRLILQFVNLPDPEKICGSKGTQIPSYQGGKEKIFQESAEVAGAQSVKGLQ